MGYQCDCHVSFITKQVTSNAVPQKFGWCKAGFKKSPLICSILEWKLVSRENQFPCLPTTILLSGGAKRYIFDFQIDLLPGI